MTILTRVPRVDRDGALERLCEFLRIPSISTDPAYSADSQLAAGWLADSLRNAGATGVRIDQTARHPVVYSECMGAPGAPTVLVYGHYDVQPPDPLDQWLSPPFRPEIRDGSVYARGAADDKGQALAHVEALLAYLEAGAVPPVNLKFVFEGEEEIGSPNLEDWIHDHARELTADIAVISDTGWVAPGVPTIVSGLRGISYLEVTVFGPTRDLHSGHFGGAVVNPITALAGMIARLHDVNGRVAIPGFYDRVLRVSNEERRALSELPFDWNHWNQITGTAGNWGDPNFTVSERVSIQPALDPNGIWGGFTGKGAKTVLPATAHAKISMRLVPNQHPDDIAELFTQYMKRLAPPGIQVTVTNLHGGQPALIDRAHPAMHAAAQAYTIGFGRAPVFAREGGSIPVVGTLQEVLGLQTVLLGFGLPDDGLHAPNEKFGLEQFYGGIETVIAFWKALAAQQH